MKNLFKKLFGSKHARTPDDELTKESGLAATYYLQEKMKHAPIDEQTKILNYIAHGFYMGWRKKEEMIGAQNGKEK